MQLRKRKLLLNKRRINCVIFAGRDVPGAPVSRALFLEGGVIALAFAMGISAAH